MALYASAIRVQQPDPSLLKATIRGAGIPGTPDTNVVTIQGVGSMTPVLTDAAGTFATSLASIISKLTNIELSIASGQLTIEYDSEAVVLPSTETLITAYTVPIGYDFALQQVLASSPYACGDYRVYVDGVLKLEYSTTSGERTATISLPGGYRLATGSLVEVRVFHENETSTKFSASIIGSLIAV